MSQIATIAAILSVISTITILVLDMHLFTMQKRKDTKMGLILWGSILIWCGTPASSTIVYLLGGSNLEIASIAQIIMYSCTFGGSMLMYIFASKIFFKPKKWFTVLYLSIGLLCIIAMFIFNGDPFNLVLNQVPFPDDPTHYALLISDEFGLVLLGYVGVTNIAIMYVAFKLAKKVDDPYIKLRAKSIGIGQLMIIGIFVDDTIASLTIDSATLYPIFLWTMWGFAILSVLFTYLGWALPAWYTRKISKNAPVTTQ